MRQECASHPSEPWKLNLVMQIRIYEDEEGVRKTEFERLSGQNQFSTFYERLKEVKDYYRKNPTSDLTEAADDEAAIDSQVCHST